MINCMKQLELPVRGRGGRRPGAGPKFKNRGWVVHLRRPDFPARFPQHVTLRVLRDVPNLREEKRWREIKRAFRYGSDRFGMRMVEFSVQSNHVHFVVEAKDRKALSKGMQGLAIRIARAVNRAVGRKGRVFADRYHSVILGSPTQVRNAVHYVRWNWHHHRAKRGAPEHPWFVDPFSSTSGEACWHLEPDDTGELVGTLVVALPRTWMLAHAAR